MLVFSSREHEYGRMQMPHMSIGSKSERRYLQDHPASVTGGHSSIKLHLRCPVARVAVNVF